MCIALLTFGIFGEKEAIRLNGNWESATGDDLAWAKLSERTKIDRQAIFAKVENAAHVERILKRLEDDKGPLSIEDSLAQIEVPDDLTVELAIGEPHVRQPLSMAWDERGRMWAMQYLQYPFGKWVGNCSGVTQSMCKLNMLALPTPEYRLASHFSLVIC